MNDGFAYQALMLLNLILFNQEDGRIKWLWALNAAINAVLLLMFMVNK